MNINENIKSDNLKEETIEKIKIKNLINIIISANENRELIYKLIELEKNEIELISNLLEILSDFNDCLLNLTPTQNLYILIYIKNTLPKYKAKPKMKQIKFLEDKIMKGIKFYLNYDYSKQNSEVSIYEKIKKFLEEIIPYLFEFIVVMEKPKNFLLNIYNNIISTYLNNSDNIFKYEEFSIRFIFIYENFCRIYLIYVFKNEEINVIFEKYYKILKLCNTNSNNNSQEINGKKFLQCILSFAKTTILSLDHFIKTKILNFSSEIINKDNNERFNFMNSKYIFKFIKHCFYLDENNNNFSLSLEYTNESNKTFECLLCKGKGVLIELLTVIIKKLSKFEFFNNYTEFNSKICEFFCNITEYLIKYYQKGNFSREKALNNSEEIIQLSTIVKSLNFMEEILDNKIYHELIENNNFSINAKNKYEKYSDIFKYIIVPNLIRTDLEKTYFDFKPNDYIQNLFDMSQNCQIKLPKQQSIKLLIIMCENIDEFLNYIIHAYVYILKNISLNYNEKENNKSIKIEQKYENLYNFLLNNIDKFNLFEQALQVLTSLYNLYCDKYYLSDFFCDEIDIINYVLIKINDPFLKSKLCNFYSVTLEILFHNENEVLSKSFDDSLNFIFDCIFSKISSLQKTAFHCLNQIIFDNYTKKFCATSVHIYALKIINFFNEKENLEGFEEEFNEFLRGIVKEYMLDLDDSTIQLFDLFWNKFYLILQKNKSDDNKNKNEILKDKTKEVNEALEISNQINIINKFVKNISNKSIEIKNNIYEKMLNLFQYLESYINTDFEEEILELIKKIALDVKLLPNIYFQYFLNFLNCFNQGINNNNNYYRMENYHIDFIFTCIQSFKIDLILNGNIKEILIKLLNNRLLENRRSIPLKKIFAEHYTYCDLGLCINIHFFGYLNKINIIDLICTFFQRMEKIPNTDYELIIKLCLNIFILLIKIDNYEIYDEIFLINKKADLYTFINKVISFFPFIMLSLIEQQIISIFCSIIIRYLIIKQKNNQEVLLCDKNDSRYFDNNNYEKIYFYIFYLNLNQLNLIKQKSINALKKLEKKEEMKNIKDKEKFIIVNSYEINDNGKAHFKNNKDMIYPEREPHNKSILNKLENKENNVYDSSDYFQNDDEFLIINEYNKRYNNENNSEDEEYYDENVDEVNEENSKEFNEENDDDKDANFLTVKKDTQNSFSNYYNKFANDKLVVSLREINEFKLFELMTKDLELNDKNSLKNIYEKISRTYGNEKLELIEKYKGMQKIYFHDKNIVSYRKIVKIIKNNILK